MFENLQIIRMAHAQASHAAARQSVITRNVANADTPGYRAGDVEQFQSYFQRLQSENSHGTGTRVQSGPRLVTLAPGGALSPNGNTVSLETEMMRAVEARHHHDMALSIYRSASNILRTSIGR